MVITVTDLITDETESFNVNELPAPIQARSTLYGVSKKTQDGDSGTAPNAKMEGYRKRFAELMEGKWNRPKQGGGFQAAPAHIQLVMELQLQARSDHH
jgi:hypothetical protein